MMADTSLIGRAKELEVAGVLIRNGIYVFWPLVDTGADLLATNRDASICIPVQVKYSSNAPALNLYKTDIVRFERPNTVIAFLIGAGKEQHSWFLPYDVWRTKAVDKNRRDGCVYVQIGRNAKLLAEYKGDAGARRALSKLFD
jgi:hypothetical protein